MLVFLDSNIYIAARYAFNNKPFDVFNSLIKRGKVGLLYTTVVEGEVLQHIADDISKAVKDYNKLIQRKSVFLAIHDEFRISKIDADKAAALITEKFYFFLENAKAQIIPLNPIDAELLIKNFFEKKLPFEAGKPYEFKDALMINAIKNFIKSNPQDICIVSNDRGFRDALSQMECCKIFEQLNDFLHYQQQLDEREKALMEYIACVMERGEFDTIIKDYIEEFYINLMLV